MLKKKAGRRWYVFEYRGKGRRPMLVYATSLGKAWRTLRRERPHVKKKHYLVRDIKQEELDALNTS